MPKPCGRIGTVVMALLCRNCSYGCAALKLYGRVGGGSYGFAVPKPCGRIRR